MIGISNFYHYVERNSTRIKNEKRKCFLLILFSFVAFLIYYTSIRPFSEYQMNKLNGNVKYVLIWSDMLGNWEFHFNPVGYQLFQQCPVKNCYITNNKNLLPIEEYDALLFYAPTSEKYRFFPIPNKRSPKQRYVFANGESPAHFKKAKLRFMYGNFFNWTMSYRLDSDIIRRYGTVNKVKTNYTFPNFKNKTRLVAWVVSNCKTTNKRELLARKLKKYIDVDIYGKCGPLNCSKSEDCFEMIEENYKFYLSFENSYCKDYTTEKFYRTLQKNLIPVVYGGGEYNQIAPPHSFINVEDFNTVKDLADYLHFLASNEEKYMEYFQWKKNYVIINKTEPACKLCEKLNNPKEPLSTYTNIYNWWFSENICKTGNQLPKILFS